MLLLLPLTMETCSRSRRSSAAWALGWVVLATTAVTRGQGQYRSPLILENPTDLLVPRNEPATLNCHASGRPQPQVTWFKDGQVFNYETTGRHVLLETGDLFFLRVLQTKKEDDAGVYWCQAANDIGIVMSRRAKLEVAVLSDDFPAEPMDTRLAEGETALLGCVPPEGRPEPVVIWERDDEVIDPANNNRYRIVDEGSLVITGVRISDTGKYVCKARNVFGERQSQAATLTVLVSPHLVSSSGPTKADEGSTIELVCRVGGDPQPEVFWRRIYPKGELPLGRMGLEEKSQVLKIHHLAPEDTGVYSCHAENPVGAVSANITVNVLSRPLIKVTPVDARVGIDGTASFECLTTGSPPPTTYWTHEGSGLLMGRGQSGTGGRISVNKFNTLTIKKVKQWDQGFYVCSAVGVSGSAFERAHLEVQDMSDMPPPIIALGALNQTLPLGTEGEMPCEAWGTPEPQIQWQRGGESIQAGGRFTITPLGTLRINRLKNTDTDIYTCIAKSETGETTWTTSISVEKPTNPNIAFFKIPDEGTLPDPPSQVEVLSINTTSVILGWHRGRPGLSSLLGYTVQFWSPELRGQWTTAKTQQTDRALTLSVNDLNPNTRYIFVVRARNSHGVSKPSTMTHTIRTLIDSVDQTIPLQEIRSRLSQTSIRLTKVEPITSTSIQVFWQLLLDASLLEGVHIRYRPLVFQKSNLSGILSVETVRLHSTIGPPPASHILTGLRAATRYEIFIVPFYQNVEGQATSAAHVTTLEDAPTIPPHGLHYSSLNSTAFKVKWDPIPSSYANGQITGYNLVVSERENIRNIVHNYTVDKPWIIVSDLKPGYTYIIQVRGLTSQGFGPISEPLMVTTLEKETVSTYDQSPPISIPPISDNGYLVIIIISASIGVFVFLAIVVYYIYRRQQKFRCQHYYNKGNGSTPWTEYPGCWGDANVGITGSMYSDVRSNGSQLHGGPVSQLCQRSPALLPAKAGYERSLPDSHYEDLDRYRLRSFKGDTNKRNLQYDPYSTNPSMTEIPVKHYYDAATLHSQHSDTQYSQMLYNGLHPDNVSLSGPVLMFPPPPTVGYEDTSRTSTLASNGSLRYGSLASNGSARRARLLLHQLPYGGSYSLGSQLSHGSPIIDSQPPRYTPRMPPSPIMRYGNTASPFSSYRRQYSHSENTDQLQSSDDIKQENGLNEEDAESHFQPLIHRPPSPNTLRKYEMEEPEKNNRSLISSSSCILDKHKDHNSLLADESDHLPEQTRVESDDIKFAVEIQRSTPLGLPPRPPPKYKRYLQQNEMESEVSVTSPLI